MLQKSAGTFKKSTTFKYRAAVEAIFTGWQRPIDDMCIICARLNSLLRSVLLPWFFSFMKLWITLEKPVFQWQTATNDGFEGWQRLVNEGMCIYEKFASPSADGYQ